MYIYMYIYIHIQGFKVWCCHIKHNVMVGCFTEQKGDR